MIRKNLIFTVFLTLTLVFIFMRPKFVLSESSTYGEDTPSGQIDLVKKVKNPNDDSWVDDLKAEDYKFSPGEEIIFLVRVKNEGEINYEKVEVEDYLPSYVELVSGETEIDFEDFAPDETREFEIKVRVVSADDLPEGNVLYCLVNKAEVEADSQKDEDTAQACIEKKEGEVLGVSVMPETGQSLLFMMAALALASAGIYISKKK